MTLVSPRYLVSYTNLPMTLLSPRTFSLICEPVTLLSPLGPLVFYIEPVTFLSLRTLSLLYEPMTLVFYWNYDHTP